MSTTENNVTADIQNNNNNDTSELLSYDIYYQTAGINSSHLEYSLNKNGKQIHRILSEKYNNLLVFGYIREYTKSIGTRDISSIVLKYFTNNKFNFNVTDHNPITDDGCSMTIENMFIDLNDVDFSTYDGSFSQNTRRPLTVSLKLIEQKCKSNLYRKSGYNVTLLLIGFKKDLPNLLQVNKENTNDNNNNNNGNSSHDNEDSNSIEFLTRQDFFESFEECHNANGAQCNIMTCNQESMKKKGFGINKNDCIYYFIQYTQMCSVDKGIYGYCDALNVEPIDEQNEAAKLRWGKSCVEARIDLDNKRMDYYVLDDVSGKLTHIHQSLLISNMNYIFGLSVGGCTCNNNKNAYDSNGSNGMKYELNVRQE